MMGRRKSPPQEKEEAVGVGVGVGAKEEVDSSTSTTTTRTSTASTTTSTTIMSNPSNLTADEVYDFYRQQLLPAIQASLPLLGHRIYQDSSRLLGWMGQRTLGFLLPSIYAASTAAGTNNNNETEASRNALLQLLEQATTSLNSTVFQHLDMDGDGQVSATELQDVLRQHFVHALPDALSSTASTSKTTTTTTNSTAVASAAVQFLSDAWWSSATFFSRHWPMMDWKIGLFLWRTCGGLLLVILLVSLLPGTMQRWVAHISRWPILGLTYFLICVELVVYIVIRVFIRCLETIFANSKHRALRRKLRQARTYDEWYTLAKQLDTSQHRVEWQETTPSSSSRRDSKRFNWSFIHELMRDMRAAKQRGDSLEVMAVLQQCTRKNIGGIMSEESFSMTNTGEPKHLVQEFVQEVASTVRWVTEEALKKEQQQEGAGIMERRMYEERLEEKTRQERTKIWTNLINWATLTFDNNNHATRMSTISESAEDDDDNNTNNNKDNDEPPSSCTTSSSEGSPRPAVVLPAQQQQQQQASQVFRRQRSLPTFDPEAAAAVQSDSNSGSPIKRRQSFPNNFVAAAASEDDDDPTWLHLEAVESSSNEEQQQQPPPPRRDPRSLPAHYHRDKVRAFLKRARAAYGRTALCLSGGAMMGLYHFGHIKALLEMDALPRIISGTSAGAVVASVVCTRTNDELRRDLNSGVLAEKLKCFALPWKDRLKEVYRNGNLFKYEDWRALITWFTSGEMTFEEAYRKTGRIFCITLSATTKKAPPVLLNYVTSPNVVIASAVLASAAVPGFIPPVRLQIKDTETGEIRNQGNSTDQLYWDGSIEQDIPTSGLAEMLNCQFFIAAQCNPHIVPFFYNPRGGVGRPNRWSRDGNLSWRGGFLLTALEMFLKESMKAKFKFLHDLEAAVGFTSTLMTQQYVGSTTIVPQVSLVDYTVLFSDPTQRQLDRMMQAGCIAAYEHGAMIKLHYLLADELDRCLDEICNLENQNNNNMMSSSHHSDGGGGNSPKSSKKKIKRSMSNKILQQQQPNSLHAHLLALNRQHSSMTGDENNNPSTETSLATTESILLAGQEEEQTHVIGFDDTETFVQPPSSSQQQQ